MNLADSILQIHPTLTDKDFIIQDDGKGPYIKWYNKEITQPTQIELETAWNEVVIIQEAEKLREQKSIDIHTIATLTDQLNLLGAVCYKLTEGNTDPEIIKARKVHEDIQKILSK